MYSLVRLLFVKIINPEKSTQYITWKIHRFSEKFTSVNALKVYLMETFGDHVPNTTDFNIGYYDGKQSKKPWLCCQDDVDDMYSDRDGGENTLWCDGRKNIATSEQIGSRKHKHVTTKQQEKEEEVDHIFSQLKDKQRDKYDHPKLRLWARMIASGLYESTDDPPDVPAFHQGDPKQKKES